MLHVVFFFFDKKKVAWGLKSGIHSLLEYIVFLVLWFILVSCITGAAFLCMFTKPCVGVCFLLLDAIVLTMLHYALFFHLTQGMILIPGSFLFIQSVFKPNTNVFSCSIFQIFL